MLFQRKRTHVFVGRVWSDPKNSFVRREEDHNLYCDTLDGSYFIVEEIEHTSGPNTSCHHCIRSIDEYAEQNPSRHKTVDDMISTHRASTSTHSATPAPPPTPPTGS